MTKLQRISCVIMCLIMLGLTALVWHRYLPDKQYKGLTISNGTELTPTSLVEPHSVYVVDNKTTFTAYTLSVEETDSTPCIGSGNNNLCELRKTTQICASRDLPLDTLIYIENIGECVIKDRLNIRYKGSNRVDILMETRQEALNFGKRELKYVIVR